MNSALVLPLADYHLLACGLLLLSLLAMRLLRQPSQRLAVVGPTFAALGLLIALCLIPGWSVVHLWQGSDPANDNVKQPIEIAQEDDATASVARPEGIPQGPALLDLPTTTQPSLTKAQEVANAKNEQPSAISLWHWTTWLLAIYGCGCLVVMAWLCLGLLAARRMTQRATAAPTALVDLLTAIAGKTKLPELRITDEIDTAVALGVFRPTILLPRSVSNATQEDQTAILAHELAHIENGDLRLLAASRWLLVLLWPQPLFWLLRRQMRLDQETLADAAAAEATDRHGYATQLVRLAREQQSRGKVLTPRLAGAVGLWETRSQLTRRIATLLDERLTVLRGCSRRWRWACGLLLGTAAVGLSLVTLEPGEVVAEEKNSEAVESAEAKKPVERKDSEEEQAKHGMLIRCVDEAGEPMEGVAIHTGIWSEPRFGGKRDFKTDHLGMTNAELPRDIRILRIWARKSGYIPLFAQWWPEHQSDGATVPAEFTFKLEKGTTIGGRILNESGEPITEAIVEVKRDSESVVRDDGSVTAKRPIYGTWLANDETAITTDREGRWTLNNVPSGKQERLRVKLSHPNYVDDEKWGGMQEAQGIILGDLRNQTAVIKMSKGVEFHGRVTSPNGNPISKAVVIWGDDPYLETGLHETLTDEQGSYRMPPLAKKPIRLTVVAEGWAPTTRVVDPAKNEPTQDFQLRAGKKLVIRFFDPSGNPIPDVWVGVDSWQVGKGTKLSKSLYNHLHPNVLPTGIPNESDNKGRYEWDWAPEQLVRYDFAKRGYRDVDDVILGAGLTVHTVTLEPEELKETPTAEVPELGDEERTEENSESNDQPDEPTKKSTRTEPAVTGNATLVKLDEQTAQNSGRFLIICLDENNQPIAGAEATLYRSEMADGRVRQIATKQTDANGEVEFSDFISEEARTEWLRVFAQQDFPSVMDENYVIRIRREGMATELAAAMEYFLSRFSSRQEVILTPARTLSGRVVDEQGKSVAGATISVGSYAKVLPMAGFRTVKTDAQGRYKFDDLPSFDLAAAAKHVQKRDWARTSFRPGPLTASEKVNEKMSDPFASALTVRHPDYATTRVIAGDIPGEFDVELKPAASISGKVIRLANGGPAAEIPVNIISFSSTSWGDDLRGALTNRLGPFVSETRTDSKGEYRFENLPAGQYTVYPKASSQDITKVDWVGNTQGGIVAKAKENAEVEALTIGLGGTLKGQIKDAQTGIPLTVDPETHQLAVILQPVGRHSSYQMFSARKVKLTADGRFEVPVLPGKFRLVVILQEMAFNQQTGRDVLTTIYRTSDNYERSGPVFEIANGESFNARIPVYSQATLEKFRQLVNRGFQESGKTAVDAFTEVLELTPNHPTALYGRSIAYAKLGRFEAMEIDAKQAFRVAPIHSHMLTYLIDPIATHPQATERDKQRVVDLVQLAVDHVRKTEPHSLGLLLTYLADAQAVAADFPAAVRSQQEAIELSGSNEQTLTERLEHYKAGKTYRDIKP